MAMKLLATSGDLIRDVCDRLAELAPALDVGVLRQIEAEARTSYGGGEVYIHARRPHADLEPAKALIQPDVPVAKQARELGLGRATIYRHLKKLSTSEKQENHCGE